MPLGHDVTKKVLQILKHFTHQNTFHFLHSLKQVLLLKTKKTKPPKQCFCLRARQVKRSYCTDQSLQAINQTFFSF